MCCRLDCIFFFFKQKTAYEMRISDWSSDVCSSDLGEGGAHQVDRADLDSVGELNDREFVRAGAHSPHRRAEPTGNMFEHETGSPRAAPGASEAHRPVRSKYGARSPAARARWRADRNSGVAGKSGSGRVDLGGRRILQK